MSYTLYQFAFCYCVRYMLPSLFSFVYSLCCIDICDCRSKVPCRDGPLQKPGVQHDQAKIFPEFAAVFFWTRDLAKDFNMRPKRRINMGFAQLRERIFYSWGMADCRWKNINHHVVFFRLKHLVWYSISVHYIAWKCIPLYFWRYKTHGLCVRRSGKATKMGNGMIIDSFV